MNALLAFLLAVGATSFIQTGTASWYDDGPGLYAAVNSFRWGDDPYDLTVCLRDGSKCVTVTVRDHCQCHVGTPKERLIDLSPAAFRRLGPLSRGLLRVTVQTAIRLPATDTAPGWRVHL